MWNARVIALAAIALAACGGSTPPSEPPKNEETSSHPQRHENINVKSEVGSIDEAATNKTLKSLSTRFMKCQEERIGAVEVLAGKVAFFIMVGEDGKPTYVYFEQSEIGDRDTERCLVERIKEAQFPRPDGGPAIVRYSIELPQRAARGPDAWDPEKVPVPEGACGTSGNAQVTAYVVAGEKKSGKVLAVGVALPEKDAESKIDCVVKTVKELKLPTPGSYVAKVSFKM